MSATIDPALLVSVLVTAYEQERYVAQALDSVLNQRLGVPFEVIVGVDASSDGTAEVVRSFERKYPERVRACYHEKRVGLHENVRSVFEAARGQFVALLEGDDYWTHPEKLHRQLEALESRPDAVLSAHLVEVRGEEGSLLGTVPRRPWQGSPSREEFLRSTCDVHTSSLLFRNVFRGAALPEFVIDGGLPVVDLPLKLALAARGELVFLPQSMSVFQRHESAASLRVSDRAWVATIAQAYELARREFDGPLRSAVDEVLTGAAVALASLEETGTKEWLASAVRAVRFGKGAGIRALLRLLYARSPRPVQDLYRSLRQVWRRKPPTGKGQRAHGGAGAKENSV